MTELYKPDIQIDSKDVASDDIDEAHAMNRIFDLRKEADQINKDLDQAIALLGDSKYGAAG